MTGNVFFFEWEVVLMTFIQSHISGNFGVWIASMCTNLGENLVPAAIMAFLYWGVDKNFGKFMACNVMAGATLNPMIKNIFFRRRPYFDNPSIRCLKPVEGAYDIYDISHQGWSFPSGHSTTGVTGYTSLAVYGKKKWLWAIGIIIPLLIGCSRFCLGVHYPTDVIAGWLSGILIILLVSFLFKHVKNQDWIFIGFIVLGFPGIFYCNTSDYFTSYGLMTGIFIGFIIERHFVNFKLPKNFLICAIRVIIGLALFEGFNFVAKIPFDKNFLNSPTFLSHMVRCVRYLLDGLIVSVGYPLLFCRVEKLCGLERK